MICFVIVLSFLLKNASASIDHLDAEVEHKCIQRCPLQVSFALLFFVTSRSNVSFEQINWGIFEENNAVCHKKWQIKKVYQTTDRWPLTDARNVINNVARQYDN